MKHWYEVGRIFSEYEQGIAYKSGLGARGLYEQNRVNERFMVGDQWHGARCGNERPLVRHNVIKRIGDYKMAVVTANPIAVNYTADGIPNTMDLKSRVQKLREDMLAGIDEPLPQAGESLPGNEEVNLVMSALSDYFRVTAERVKLDDLKEQTLRNAYVTGTGVLYTYWDESISTGLYADESRRLPIRGDIVCEALDVENVYFGDPSCDNVQKQPYIILAKRCGVEEIKRIARANHRPADEIDAIRSDADYGNQAGDYGRMEQRDSRRTWLLTKLYKEWQEDGSYVIKAVQVCRGATVRKPWNIGIRLYPVTVFRWERRRNCIYGESEITYLIPNQIAINRMLTASVWAVMMMGMPMLVVNGDVIQQAITNEPGQIVKVHGGVSDVQASMRYLNPPNFSPAFDNMVASLIANTLTQSGANDSALGDVRPDNTSAIIAVREAALMPMQTVQNRFYSFIEDLARIWAEFWVMQYGARQLKIEERGSTWYLPFDGARYRDLLISARVDVGASTLWSESQSIRTLDSLFGAKVINVLQYLERLPKGTVPDVNGLIRELQKADELSAQAMREQGSLPSSAAALPTSDEVLSGLDEESRALFDSLSPEQQAAMLQQAMQTTGGVPDETVQSVSNGL